MVQYVVQFLAVRSIQPKKIQDDFYSSLFFSFFFVWLLRLSSRETKYSDQKVNILQLQIDRWFLLPFTQSKFKHRRSVCGGVR